MPTQLPLLFVVENDPAVGRALELLLTTMGWDVRLFQTAEECLRMALAQPPACILADLYLPGMNSVELKQALLAGGIHVPMVILTAYFDTPLAASAKFRGVEEILEKPCDSHALQAALQRVLRSSFSSH